MSQNIKISAILMVTWGVLTLLTGLLQTFFFYFDVYISEGVYSKDFSYVWPGLIFFTVTCGLAYGLYRRSVFGYWGAVLVSLLFSTRRCHLRVHN